MTEAAAADPFGGLQAARERVAAQFEQARQRQEDVRALAADVAAARATATSRRGEVTVTAAANGTILDVELSPGALELDAPALGRLIADTVRDAQREAAHSALRLTERTLGPASPMAERIREDVEQRYGAPDPGPGAPDAGYMDRFRVADEGDDPRRGRGAW